jgi:hypothetical protein
MAAGCASIGDETRCSQYAKSAFADGIETRAALYLHFSIHKDTSRFCCGQGYNAFE